MLQFEPWSLKSTPLPPRRSGPPVLAMQQQPKRGAESALQCLSFTPRLGPGPPLPCWWPCRWLMGRGELPREASAREERQPESSQRCSRRQDRGGTWGCWAGTSEGAPHVFPVPSVSFHFPRNGGPRPTDARVSDPSTEERGPSPARIPIPLDSPSFPQPLSTCAQTPTPCTSWPLARAPSGLGLLDLRTHHSPPPPRTLGTGQRHPPRGPGRLAALHHLQPEGTLPCPEPGARGRELHCSLPYVPWTHRLGSGERRPRP